MGRGVRWVLVEKCVELLVYRYRVTDTFRVTGRDVWCYLCAEIHGIARRDTCSVTVRGVAVKVESVAKAHNVDRIYLRGTTAGYELSEESLARGNCLKYGEAAASAATDEPLRIWHQFPLEEIAECEVDFVEERFDIVVGSWTMLHLADPLGTLVQLYSLLAPQGLLLLNFCYAHIGDGDKQHLKTLVGAMKLSGYETYGSVIKK